MQSYGSNTIYHSLQTRFEHRLSDQLNLTAAYTYSHLIDDSANTTNDGGCQCQNPRDIAAERASSLFDQRHLLVIGYVWNIPFAKDMDRGRRSRVAIQVVVPRHRYFGQWKPIRHTGKLRQPEQRRNL